MSSNLVYLPCRLSVRMMRELDMLSAKHAEHMTKQQLIQNMINQYILNPVRLDPSETIALREPVTETMSIGIEDSIHKSIRLLATDMGVPLSVVIRMAILRWLEQEGDA